MANGGWGFSSFNDIYQAPQKMKETLTLAKYNSNELFEIEKNNPIRTKILPVLKKDPRKNNIIAFISFEALHLSKVGKRFLTKNTKLKNTEEIVKKIVRLPMHNRLNIKDIDFISNKVKKYFKK